MFAHLFVFRGLHNIFAIAEVLSKPVFEHSGRGTNQKVRGVLLGLFLNTTSSSLPFEPCSYGSRCTPHGLGACCGSDDGDLMTRGIREVVALHTMQNNSVCPPALCDSEPNHPSEL